MFSQENDYSNYNCGEDNYEENTITAGLNWVGEGVTAGEGVGGLVGSTLPKGKGVVGGEGVDIGVVRLMASAPRYCTMHVCVPGLKQCSSAI